jgi:hypothetical protein
MAGNDAKTILGELTMSTTTPGKQPGYDPELASVRRIRKMPWPLRLNRNVLGIRTACFLKTAREQIRLR